METILTKQDILKLFALQSEQIEKSRAEFDEKLAKNRIEFDQRLGELAGTKGKFVDNMVQSKIVELFQARNIQIVCNNFYGRTSKIE
ncbi:MAG: hypothetical protein WCJ95_15955 [Mariniphaga sp.]